MVTRPSRGLILISGLLFTVLVSFVVLAALKLAPGALGSAETFTDRQLAILAAESGLEYARVRLREDALWRGGEGPAIRTVRSSDGSLVVFENEGNVVGIVQTGPQEYGQFRIRFNHQGGSSDLDGRPDPEPEYRLDLPWISSNNLSGSGPMETYQESNGAVTVSPDLLPAFQTRLCIEGRAGPALRNLGPESVHPPLAPGRSVSVVLTSDLRSDFGQALDSVVMAGSNFQATIAPPLLRDHGMEDASGFNKRRLRLSGNRRDGAPRVRSKGTIGVTGGAARNLYASEDAEVHSVSGDVEDGTTPNNKISLETEATGAAFYQMSFDDVKKADPTSPDTVRLQAGTYVVNPDYSVDYFDMAYSDYEAAMLTGSPPTPTHRNLSVNLSEVRSDSLSGNPLELRRHNTSDPLKLELVMKKDVFVEASPNSVEDFSFITARGPVEGPPVNGVRPGQLANVDVDWRSIDFLFSPSSSKEAILSCEGQVLINAEVKTDRLPRNENGEVQQGQQVKSGSIVADNLKIVGGSLFEANTVDNESSGVNFYSRKDIDINTYLPSRNSDLGHFYNLNLKGVLYAWGDVRLRLGPSVHETDLDAKYTRSGHLIFHGALVAYGADPGAPGNPPPGSGLAGGQQGTVNIEAGTIFLRYNSRYLGTMLDQSLPTGLDLVSWSLR